MGTTAGDGGVNGGGVPRAPSVKVLLAEKVLKGAIQKQGDVCSYEQLAAALGEDPQREGYSHVSRACHRIEANRNAMGVRCVLRPIPKFGIKWLTNDEVSALGARDVRRINRAAKRAGNAVATLIGEDLNPEAAKLRDIHLVVFATAQGVSSSKAVKKLAEVCDGNGRLLGIEETLKALR